MIYVVHTESNDYCGCFSEYYLVEAKTQDEAIDLVGGKLDDEVFEFYDEDDEAYDEPSYSVHAEEYDREFGPITLYRWLNEVYPN